MERQHSKGGFTRLIAALPTLCMRVTPATVREAFLCVDSKATQTWIQDSLGSTLRTVPEITVPLSPFALRKMRGFRGAKDDTKFQNGPYRPPQCGLSRIQSKNTQSCDCDCLTPFRQARPGLD